MKRKVSDEPLGENRREAGKNKGGVVCGLLMTKKAGKRRDEKNGKTYRNRRNIRERKKKEEKKNKQVNKKQTNKGRDTTKKKEKRK